VQDDATADFELKRRRLDLINPINHIKNNDRAMLRKNVGNLAQAINIQGNWSKSVILYISFDFFSQWRFSFKPHRKTMLTLA